MRVVDTLKFMLREKSVVILEKLYSHDYILKDLRVQLSLGELSYDTLNLYNRRIRFLLLNLKISSYGIFRSFASLSLIP